MDSQYCHSPCRDGTDCLNYGWYDGLCWKHKDYAQITVLEAGNQ